MKKPSTRSLIIILAILSIYVWFCRNGSREVHPTGIYYNRSYFDNGTYQDLYLAFDGANTDNPTLTMYKFVSYEDQGEETMPRYSFRITYPMFMAYRHYKLLNPFADTIYCRFGKGDFTGYNWWYENISLDDSNADTSAWDFDFTFTDDSVYMGKMELKKVLDLGDRYSGIFLGD